MLHGRWACCSSLFFLKLALLKIHLEICKQNFCIFLFNSLLHKNIYRQPNSCKNKNLSSIKNAQCCWYSISKDLSSEAAWPCKGHCIPPWFLNWELLQIHACPLYPAGCNSLSRASETTYTAKSSKQSPCLLLQSNNFISISWRLYFRFYGSNGSSEILLPCNTTGRKKLWGRKINIMFKGLCYLYNLQCSFTYKLINQPFNRRCILQCLLNTRC